LKDVLINVDELSEAINNALTEYNENVVIGLKKQTNRAMNDLVKNTKADAPVGKREKHYRDHITQRTESETKFGIEKMWYVKSPDYRLSHLLEYGHATRDGGRTKAYGFIKKNTDRIIDWYLPMIEEIIKNG
jgi:hypothetical protein